MILFKEVMRYIDADKLVTNIIEDSTMLGDANGWDALIAQLNGMPIPSCATCSGRRDVEFSKCFMGVLVNNKIPSLSYFCNLWEEGVYQTELLYLQGDVK